MKPSLSLCLACLLHMLTTLSATAAGVIGAGSLATPRNGAHQTHTWIVMPVDASGRSTVLHLPPRTGAAEQARLGSPREGEARIASVLASTPVAAAARGSRLAVVFPDSRDGVPSLHGRTVLTLGATPAGPGEWKIVPEKRLDPLPSLRGDGLLLGFSASDMGYAALFQGLATEDADPARPVLYVLSEDTWNEVALPPELQAAGAEAFQRQGDRPVALATWRLFATEAGLGICVITRRDAAEPIRGTVFLADFSGSNPGSASATWTRRDLLLDAHGSVPSDQVEVVAASGHIVVSARSSEGTLHLYSQTARTPGLWRHIAEVTGIAPDHSVTPIESLHRIAVISAPQRTGSKDAPPYRMVEVSVGTGAVLSDGPLVIRSPVGVSDYRLIGLLLAYALGLVIIFVLRPPARESLHLPAGVSIAEPGRRMIASLIDLTIAVLVSCKLLGVPLAEFFGSGLLTPGPAQSVAMTSLALLIVANSLLETLMGRSLGKLIAGCGVVMMRTGPAPASGEPPQPQAPSFWRALVRNFVKWGLPPVALLGLMDPGGRHRGDLLAGTAVAIEAPDDEPESPED